MARPSLMHETFFDDPAGFAYCFQLNTPPELAHFLHQASSAWAGLAPIQLRGQRYFYNDRLSEAHYVSIIDRAITYVLVKNLTRAQAEAIDAKLQERPFWTKLEFEQAFHRAT